MHSKFMSLGIAGGVLLCASAAMAGTRPYFVPLTQSAPVTLPNSNEELNAPWVVPQGVRFRNFTSMREIESSPGQTVGRAPNILRPDGSVANAGNVQSMWDMSAYDPSGRFIFVPHESPWSAGLSRYDTWLDHNDLLWAGDGQGVNGNWSNDYAAFDPAIFTPNCTVFASEEWSGEGRVMETMNPFAPVNQIQVRELQSIANVSHEGTKFSADGQTIYYIDEWRSGSIYKFVMKNQDDYTVGQTFVLVVTAFNGNPEDNYNDASNVGQPRTGAARWVPITDENGNYTTIVDPFMNGPTNDPRTNTNTRGGRPAADEVNGTPYGRPEDLEIGFLNNGTEVLYFTATSENSVYSIELTSKTDAYVRLFASGTTAKNVGFPATTGVLNSPDNLAQDALGNIYIIEDAPNGSSTGGDIWFARDMNGDGVAESLDHFLSIRVDGSEATGMIFNPRYPAKFVVNVQHPDSTNLDRVTNGFGDASWEFEISNSPDWPVIRDLLKAGRKQNRENREFRKKCRKAMRRQMRER